MSITVNDLPCHRAELHVPWSKRWTIKVAATADVVLEGRVTVSWGEATFVGTVDPDASGVWQGEFIAVIVGGAGWSEELPAQWSQSDNPGVSGQTIASQAAALVGETLTAPASAFRPLRVSYSRPQATAAEVLDDTLAPGAQWWIDFDGVTRAGARPAPPVPARVTLLEDHVAMGWAELDADDPSQVLVGSIIAPDATRGLPSLRITELWAWAGPDVERYRVSTAPAPVGSSRLVSVLSALARASAPELAALQLRRARVTAQASDGRVSLQQVDRSGRVADFGRPEGAVTVFSGVPGTSAELDVSASPECILAFSRGDWSDPLALLAAAKGQPGHVPLIVRHEAGGSIRFVTESAGNVYVGQDPQPVACADVLVEYLVALEAYLATIDLTILGAAALLSTPPPNSAVEITAAIEARVHAAGYIPPGETATFTAVRSTRLFAEHGPNVPGPPGGGGP